MVEVSCMIWTITSFSTSFLKLNNVYKIWSQIIIMKKDEDVKLV